MTCYEHPLCEDTPDSKDHGANMVPIWGRQDPCGPHVGPMNFAPYRFLHELSYLGQAEDG